ncbi:hypothetical protein MLD38_032023 [Melastoma candidum]|uniref:Uncharacterized protein n=1 Tax=Melastoma candidum TaxID=119954 RepID=A0ACB9MRH1_9MYRT|nr:hypothetical protein MLD38_032023 [Melastoma candidum]
MKKVGIKGEDDYRKGLWTVEEDRLLADYIQLHGKGKWSKIPLATGLKRCGKSCRLRWVNYLCPNVKRGHFSPDEEDLIVRLHKLLGNRWSLIAGRVPGRTDNQVKNHWNTHLSKKLCSNHPTRDFTPTTTSSSSSRHPPPSIRRPSTHMPSGSCPAESSLVKKTAEEHVPGEGAMPASPGKELWMEESGRTSAAWFFDDELNLICSPKKVVRSSGDSTLDFIMHGT